MAGSISDQTTGLSNLSVDGNLVVGGTFSSSTFSGLGQIGGTLIFGSDLSSTNTVRGAIGVLGTSLAVGGGTAITRIQKGTISVVTMTCTGQGSTTTTASVPPLTTADYVLINATSSFSSGADVRGYVSGNSTVTLVFSNTSTASLVLAGPLTIGYVAFRS